MVTPFVQGVCPPHSCNLCNHITLDFSEDSVYTKRKFLQNKIRDWPPHLIQNVPFWVTQPLDNEEPTQNRETPKTRNRIPFLSTLKTISLKRTRFAKPNRRDHASNQLASRAIISEDLLRKEIQYRFSQLMFLESSREDVKQRANKGCSFFSLLGFKLDQRTIEGKEIPSNKTFLIAIELGIEDLVVGLPVFHATYGIRDMDLYPLWDAGLLTSDDQPISTWVRRRPININPAIEPTLRLYQNWYENCITRHQDCPKAMCDYTPTRVLAISDLEGDCVIRLEDAGHGHAVPFAALSYCWGERQKLVACQESIEMLKSGLTVDKLPRTLREAVDITRGLGLGHLWIDALCILQDSKDDIAAEIANMPRIYSQAAVTIAASRSSGASEGFLQQRPPAGSENPDSVFQFQFRSLTGDEGNVVAVPKTTYGLVAPAPLDTRAWALQERLLSPRILDFDQHQTRWVCKSSYLSPVVDGYEEDVTVSSTDRNYNLHQDAQAIVWGHERSRLSEIDPRGIGGPFRQWQKLVERYTNRHLSYETDRLPAIGALADTFSKFLGEVYVAGLWKKHLPEGLLWRNGSKILREKSPKYIAPSWAWATLNGPINHLRLFFHEEPGPLPVHTFNSDDRFRVLDSEVKLRYPKLKFGEVSFGELVLEARSSLVLWCPGDAKHQSEQAFTLQRLGREETIPAMLTVDFVVDDFEKKDAGGIPVHMLIISGEYDFSYFGIIVRELPSGKYSRAGMFQLHAKYSSHVDLSVGVSWSNWASNGYQDEISWILDADVHEFHVV